MLGAKKRIRMVRRRTMVECPREKYVPTPTE
jgi:hypothetical protein